MNSIAKHLVCSLLILFVLIACKGKTEGQTISMPKDRPNILWITIEDTSPQFVGCYGNKNASTPVIDKLAQEGVRFTNAFSTGTVCSPSRSCIITGIKTYKLGTGNHRSNYPIPDFIKGFPYYLQQAGYYTTNNKKTDYNVGNVEAFTKDAWDECSGKAGWWNRKPGQPFFSVFNFMDSHQSRTMTNPYDWYLKHVYDKLPQEERIADTAFDMPPFYRDSPEMRKQFARVYNSLKLTDDEIGALLERLKKDKLMDSTIIFFYADHGEGEPRGKTNGINLGYRVPFVIWFPEKYKDLSPWGTSGVVTDELVDFEDLAPTVISMAGGTVPNYLKGRILMGKDRSRPTDHLVLSSDRSDNGTDKVRTVTNGRFVYSRNFMPFMPEARYINYMEIGEIKQQMRKDLAEDKLNSLQKSLFVDRPAEFLFDIKNDIWETKNLVNDPYYKKVLETMRKQLKTEILKSRDVMLLPEYEIGQISKTTTPYEFRLDDENYPISVIYDAASLAGFRNQEVAEKQIALLNHPNAYVRYWAALGLRSQGSDVLSPYKNEIMNAMGDSYPPVSILSSVLAWKVFADPVSATTLKAYCADGNEDLALMAINNLIYVNDSRPFLETVRQVREREGISYRLKSSCTDFLSRTGAE